MMLLHMLLPKVLNHQLIMNTPVLKVLANTVLLKLSLRMKPILMSQLKITLDYKLPLLNSQLQLVLKQTHNNSNYIQLVSSTMLDAELILITVFLTLDMVLIQKVTKNIG